MSEHDLLPHLDGSGHAALRRPQSGTPEPLGEEEQWRLQRVMENKLFDLAMGLDPNLATIGILARIQIWTYQRTGHIIDLGHEYTWRKIQAHNEDGTLPRCYARCMRCGCRALLYQWATAATPHALDKVLLRGQGNVAAALSGTAYLEPCGGGNLADEVLFVTQRHNEKEDKE